MKKVYYPANMAIIAIHSNDIIATSNFDMSSTSSVSSIRGYNGQTIDRYDSSNDTFYDNDSRPVTPIW